MGWRRRGGARPGEVWAEGREELGHREHSRKSVGSGGCCKRRKFIRVLRVSRGGDMEQQSAEVEVASGGDVRRSN